MKEINVKFFPLLLGVYSGAGILVFIDAWISVSLIDMNDPSTWPDMHPWIRVYFIPIVGTVFAAAASIIEFIRSFIWKTNITKFSIWFLLGISYTIILSGSAFSRLLPFAWSVFFVVLLVIALNPVLVHFIFGRTKIVESV